MSERNNQFEFGLWCKENNEIRKHGFILHVCIWTLGLLGHKNTPKTPCEDQNRYRCIFCCPCNLKSVCSMVCSFHSKSTKKHFCEFTVYTPSLVATASRSPLGLLFLDKCLSNDRARENTCRRRRLPRQR